VGEKVTLFEDRGVASWPVALEDLAAAHAARRMAKMQTADLVALRRLLTKGNPYHDELGRFTTGAGSEAELSLTGVHLAANSWSNWSYMFRRALADPNAALETTQAQQGGRSVAADARTLLGAANAAPPTTYPLYRGIGLNDRDYAQFREAMKPGSTVDLNLASWTKSENVAREFAGNNWGTVPYAVSADKYPDHQVIFQMEPGAHAYDATNDISQGPQYTEHLAAGRFVVTNVTSESTYSVEYDMRNPGVDVITLRQVATLAPPALVGTKLEKGYNEDEARDDRGEWTDGGTTRYPSVVAAAARWGMDSNTIRDAIVAGKPGPNGKALLAALAGSPANGPTLVRGMALSRADAQYFVRGVGTRLDLNLSSWTTNPDIAKDFSWGVAVPGDVPILLNLERGSQALDVSSLIAQSPQGDTMAQNEWLTGGRFRITSITPYTASADFGPTAQPGYQISLKQTGYLRSDPAAQQSKGT